MFPLSVTRLPMHPSPKPQEGFQFGSDRGGNLDLLLERRTLRMVCWQSTPARTVLRCVALGQFQAGEFSRRSLFGTAHVTGAQVVTMV